MIEDIINNLPLIGTIVAVPAAIVSIGYLGKGIYKLCVWISKTNNYDNRLDKFDEWTKEMKKEQKNQMEKFDKEIKESRKEHNQQMEKLDKEIKESRKEHNEQMKEMKKEHNERMEKFDKEMKESKKEHNDLKEKVDKIYRVIVASPTLESSPIKLTDSGEEIANKIKARSIFDKHKNFLSQKIKEKNPQNEYDIQQISLAIVKEHIENIVKPNEVDIMKKIAYEKGLLFEDVISIFGVYLRDQTLKEKNMEKTTNK